MDKEWKIKIGGLKESANDFDKLKKSVDDSRNSLANQNRTVGDYSKAIREANKEIKNIQGEMLGLEKGSKAWTELAKKAGDYKDRIDDIREATRRYASDTKNLDDVINLAQSATAAFTLYKGAMASFGLETENAEKALTELAGAMSIIQSLQTLSNTLKGSSATASLFNKAMKLTGVELVQTQLAAIKATSAQEGLSTAQKAGTVATKTLSLALKAIPLMFIIGLVTTLITHWEDLVGWFEDTFPALKKLGGAMNALKGVVVGLGKAVVHWLINPWETFAKVIKRIMAGDFKGAIEEAVNGVKNQFTGLGKAVKEGFQEQVERGMEEMSRKAATEMDKTLTHQKNMITKQKNADGTYRKEYIEANKKMFANRKKMYKKDSDEYRKVLEEEAQFFQQVEDAKESAAKKSAAERAKANKAAAKAAADAAKQAAKEAEEKRKEYADSFDRLVQATAASSKIALETQLKLLEAEAKSLYENGNWDEYKAKLDEIKKIQLDLYTADGGSKLIAFWKTFSEQFKEANLEFEKFKDGAYEAIEIAKKAGQEGKNLTEEEIENIAKLYFNINKLNETQRNNFKAILQGILNEYQLTVVKEIELEKEKNKTIEEQDKKRYEDAKTKAKKSIDNINSLIKSFTSVEAPNVVSVYDRIFDPKKAKKAEELYKKYWKDILDKTKKEIPELIDQWYIYLFNVEKIYGKDSKEYRDACEEKKKAFKDLLEFQEKAEKGSNGKVVSLDEPPKGAIKSPINQNEYTKDAGGNTNWEALWDKENTLVDNLVGNFQLLDEMVLAPAMDTFSMFMDFAIEETAQRLEQVQELHDKAMDKVEESADKIKELNESLRDSGNDNMEATKQQLADEQLLYAQRLAEERKLADEERALKNKQAQQEANARKMELRYQMVMAVANTAQGASKALAQWGWPLGAVFAGLMAALGAVQVGLIAKQIGAVKPVKYAEGGIINGKPHSQGGARIEGTNLEVEGGEMVVSKKNTQRYRDVLYKINNNDPSVRYLQGSTRQYADTKIRKYADGGTLNFDRADESLRTQQDTNKLMSAIDGINMNPIVTVKDIWKAEDRLVKVRGLAGR